MEAGFQFPAQDWRADIYAALKRQHIIQVGYVPDAGHATLIKALHADPQMKVSVLTTEAEGVALLAGADLGGERGVLLMQSSGVGNCVNMHAADAGAVTEAAVRIAYDSAQPVAVLLSQRLIGAKAF